MTPSNAEEKIGEKKKPFFCAPSTPSNDCCKKCGTYISNGGGEKKYITCVNGCDKNGGGNIELFVKMSEYYSVPLRYDITNIDTKYRVNLGHELSQLGYRKITEDAAIEKYVTTKQKNDQVIRDEKIISFNGPDDAQGRTNVFGDNQTYLGVIEKHRPSFLQIVDGSKIHYFENSLPDSIIKRVMYRFHTLFGDKLY